jgi:hypothetical protein
VSIKEVLAMGDANKNAGIDQQVVDEPTPEQPISKQPNSKQPRDSSALDAERRRAVFFLAVGAALGGAGLLLSRPARADMGKCYICSGCCGFQGSTDNCNRCGHSYSDHTGRTCT